jgi:hypothetical protein
MTPTREAIGWILSGLGGLCALRVMAISARHGVPPQLDRRSFLEAEFQDQKTQQQVPGFSLLVFLGLGLSLVGMYLIGMFG